MLRRLFTAGRRNAGFLVPRQGTTRASWRCAATWIALSTASWSLAQGVYPKTSPPPEMPEAIYWKQTRFMIPYQWSAPGGLSAAQSVRLFISKDRGQIWQPLSEAKANVRGFTYHAGQDGEFWFSIRTIDSLGRAWPNEPYRPELRVIVDTTFPQIEELGGVITSDRVLDIYCKATDLNLKPSETRIQLRADQSESWQQVTVIPEPTGAVGTMVVRASWQVPSGTARILLRAEVYDKAGNRSFRGANLIVAQSEGLSKDQFPMIISGRDQLPEKVVPRHNLNRLPPSVPPVTRQMAPQPVRNPFDALPNATLPPQQTSPALPADSIAARHTGDGPVSNPNSWQPSPSTRHVAGRGMVPVTPQPWPADSQARESFAELTTPFNTARREPEVVYEPSSGPSKWPDLRNRPNMALASNPRRVSSLPQTPSTLPRSENSGIANNVVDPLVASFSGGRGSTTNTPPTELSHVKSLFGQELPPGVEPRMVSSRTFDLDYALESAGQWGVSRVELWGTRDGGKTWRNYALDDDNRSPLRVRVEGEGLYGFRLVARSTGVLAAAGPQPGDPPELWVAVDMEVPRTELLSVQQGVGNVSDHLVIRWRVEDSNLESQPIALFYSSRAGGPWSAVATGLENTGEYAWRLDRHLPGRFYLRLEARDLAGNVASYQTPQPIVLNRAQPTVRLRGVHMPGASSGVE